MPGIDLSLEKAAQFFGVDPRTINRWLRDGCPGAKDAKGRWALNSASVSDWRTKRERESALGEVSSVDEQEARRRKIAAEAALAEHELAIKQGSAVAVADFESQMAAMVGAARARLLNLGSKLGPLVIGCGSPAEAKDLIDDGVREVLRELSELDGNEVPVHADGPGESEAGGEESRESVGSAAGSNHQRVGRRKPQVEPRGKR